MPVAFPIRSPGSLVSSKTTSVPAMHWARLFRASFTILFLGYPGIALKIMRLFKCVSIDGQVHTISAFFPFVNLRLLSLLCAWCVCLNNVCRVPPTIRTPVPIVADRVLSSDVGVWLYVPHH